MKLLDDIRAATDTLNSYLIEAARLGIQIDVCSGITPPMRDNFDKSHFYIAKCVVIIAKP
jgi:hypothetical protein